MGFGRSFKEFFFGKEQKECPKIICTLGTTTDDEVVLRGVREEGMSIARINTAYASLSEYKKRIDMLFKVANGKIPVMMDLKGSQIRIFTDKKYGIEVGSEFPVGFKKGSIYFNHDFYEEIMVGEKVFFENGLIKTIVLKKQPHYVILKVVNAYEGHLTNHMGVNIPSQSHPRFTNIPLLTDWDIEVIDFALLNPEVRFLAMSFVRSEKDLIFLRNTVEERRIELKKASWDFTYIAKIEEASGFVNLDKIIKTSHQKNLDIMIMVARGDLFVETPQYELAFIQKQIVKKCNDQGVPVIVATGLLESMQNMPYPTRAEVCDVANAVLDGSDYLMLSGETSNGRDPVAATKMLKTIIDNY